MADGIAFASLPVISSYTGDEETLFTIGGVTKRGTIKSLFGAPPYSGTESLIADGTVSLNVLHTKVVNSGGVTISVALPAGTAANNGTRKIISVGTSTSTVTVTATTGIGFSSVILATGHSLSLIYEDGWRILSKYVG